MEPKFQSSFIPKGPVAPSAAAPRAVRPSGERDILSLLGMGALIISIILAAGAFGYKLYLGYRISQMGSQLQAARQSLSPDVVKELLDLDNRIASTKTLLGKHVVLTPLFVFLENSTPKSVRYTGMDYESTAEGLTLTLDGEAKSYAALAAAADLFNQSPYFKSPVFSDLNLDDKGNVIFTMKATIAPSLVSYEKSLESTAPAASVQTATSTPAASATSSAVTATTSASFSPTGKK